MRWGLLGYPQTMYDTGLGNTCHAEPYVVALVRRGAVVAVRGVQGVVVVGACAAPQATIRADEGFVPLPKVAALVAIRGIGKREALQKLAELTSKKRGKRR